ncbi:MAG: (d)CMP kinase [Candidatus Dependentiae bacterium]
MIITLDGPVASGKSTIARLLADKLGFYYLNTGIIYRACAYVVLRQGKQIDQATQDDIKQIMTQIAYSYANGAEKITYNDQNITAMLTTPAVDEAASKISAIAWVRPYADALQRRLVKDKDAVIDGRDSGSVVFADADYKFYITASDTIRAQRWQKKQKQRNKTFSLQEALEHIKSRDDRDSHREIAPLVIPHDACVIENNGNHPEQVVQQILSGIKK